MEGGFPNHTHDELGFYVYSLVDPRTGNTFYIGKGRGNRIFAHAKAERNIEHFPSDRLSLKLDLIRQIHKSGIPISYRIIRWNLKECEALLLEAALIDFVPELASEVSLANKVSGHHSSKYGIIPPEELVGKLSKIEVSFDEPVILVDITRSFSIRNPERESLYDAIRWAWPLNKSNAEKCKYVLAHRNGVIIAVFHAKYWREVNPKNFPDISQKMRNAYKTWKTPKMGFSGHQVNDAEVVTRYVGKLVPDIFRNSQTGVRYAPSPKHT